MTRKALTLTAGALFVGSVWFANYLTDSYGVFPLASTVVAWGTLAAGASLVLRDAVHELGGRRLVLALIVVGAILSAGLSGALALASGVAFLVSELVDALIYVPARARFGRPRAILLSGLAAAPVDTLLFLAIGPLPLATALVLGQVIVKSTISATAAGIVART